VTFPVLAKDNSDSKMIATAANGWLNVDPDIERAMEESNVEWIVACDELLKSNI
jgi:hypothetical protein